MTPILWAVVVPFVLGLICLLVAILRGGDESIGHVATWLALWALALAIGAVYIGVNGVQRLFEDDDDRPVCLAQERGVDGEWECSQWGLPAKER